MKNFLSKIINDRFIKNNFIFFIGLLFVSVLNYLYYPVLGRVLSVEDFGEAQTINTLVLQSMVVLGALGYVSIHLFTNIEDKNISTEKVRNLEGATLLISITATVAIFVFRSNIISYFKFSSFVSLFSICLIFLIAVPFTIKRSWLQAEEDFFAVSVAGAISAIGKLLIAVALILLGFKISGVLAGLILATLLSLIYVHFKSDTGVVFSKHLTTNYLQKIATDPELRSDLYYGAMIFISLIAVTIFYSADVIFVRRYFSTTISGLYAGVSAIANIIFFATWAFSNVMLPTIRIGGAKTNKTNLYKALVITVLIGSAIWLLFILSPTLVISIMLGERYLEYSGLLPQISMFILLASITNVILVYLIALKKKAAPIIAGSGVFLLFILVSTNNGSVETIVRSFIYTNLIVLLICFIYLFVHLRKQSIPE